MILVLSRGLDGTCRIIEPSRRLVRPRGFASVMLPGGPVTHLRKKTGAWRQASSPHGRNILGR
ncbi:hypothetical protein NOVOSPHI9U_20143 [Novosphingobium sp. 9U]|nr:hypothetical protein NOVOSPHI9U_20143 [Novosphingobium sp. 9U]